MFWWFKLTVDIAKEIPHVRIEVGRRVLEILAKNYMPDMPTETTKVAFRKRPAATQASPLQRLTQQYSLDDTLYTALDFDSLDTIEFVMCMEDEFGISIPDGNIYQDSTLRKVLMYVGDNAPSDYRPSRSIPSVRRN